MGVSSVSYMGALPLDRNSRTTPSEPTINIGMGSQVLHLKFLFHRVNEKTEVFLLLSQIPPRSAILRDDSNSPPHPGRFKPRRALHRISTVNLPRANAPPVEIADGSPHGCSLLVNSPPIPQISKSV